jgi:hypothetical protein
MRHKSVGLWREPILKENNYEGYAESNLHLF